ncbi:MAG: hypothetical protein GY799_12250 [Desulfobulbaceae bacterium]|nr:hypothetical protein [Desulfobulbaceae bacterium]
MNTKKILRVPKGKIILFGDREYRAGDILPDNYKEPTPPKKVEVKLQPLIKSEVIDGSK